MDVVPSRRQPCPQYTWDLQSIYLREDLWDQDIESVRARMPQLEAFEGRLEDSPGYLLACLRSRDSIQQIMDQLLVYAQMRLDEDNTNNRYRSMVDQAQALDADLSSSCSFIEFEIASMPEGKLGEFIASEPQLAPYRHYFENSCRQRTHMRSAEVEAVLAQTTQLANTPAIAWDALVNADLDYPLVADEQGRATRVDSWSYARLRECKDRTVRRQAFEALHRTYYKHRNTLAALLGSSVRSDIFYAQCRDYQTALEAVLAPDNIPIKVYHCLIATVGRRLPLLHRYMRLRKRLLAVDKLHYYDLYVPMASDAKVEIPYEDAVRMVQEALAPLGVE